MNCYVWTTLEKLIWKKKKKPHTVFQSWSNMRYKTSPWPSFYSSLFVYWTLAPLCSYCWSSVDDYRWIRQCCDWCSPVSPTSILQTIKSRAASKRRAPSALILCVGLLMCVLVCVHSSKSGLLEGVVMGRGIACVLYRDCTWVVWSAHPPPSYCCLQVNLSSSNGGWSNPAIWEVFTVISPLLFVWHRFNPPLCLCPCW